MHIPVLQKEVLKYLDPKPNENFIDCTFGEGGHSRTLLEKNGPRGKVLGIDQCSRPDLEHLERLVLVEDNFVNLKNIVERYKFKPVNGILFDLGMSSWHLEESGRGFSFQRREPLDMRYGLSNQLTAEKIVNFWSKSEIEKILREYGEEKRAGKIAEKIIEARRQRQIKSTFHLREIIKRAGSAPRRSFQALRIAVNDELNSLEKTLPQAMEILQPSGRLAVISFHSLEDRIVKNYFKKQACLSADRAKEGSPIIKILTKKPIIPSLAETRTNPRSRSAKLRAVQKI